MATKVHIDRTNGYGMTMTPTASFKWGLFVPVERDRSSWQHNFFFKTRKAADTHGRKCFAIYAVGKVEGL